MTESMGDPAEGTVARSRSPKGRSANGTVPVLRQIFPAPVAAKVPEVIALFWVVKILTTAGGEATSDFLKNWGNIKGGGTEVLLFAIGLVLQFGTRRYRAIAYWFLAYSIAIFGTGVSDFLHLDVGIPTPGRPCCGGSFWLPSSGSGDSEKERCPSTASPRNDGKHSTGRPCSRPSRSELPS